MASDNLPGATTPFGERVRKRLRDEKVIWLTTQGADGTPQPNPVWFIWEESGALLVYNRANARRLDHINRAGLVALNFNSTEGGSDIVVFRGRMRRLGDHPLPHQVPSYLDKYRDDMIGVSGSPEKFSAAYPVASRIEILGTRGF